MGTWCFGKLSNVLIRSSTLPSVSFTTSVSTPQIKNVTVVGAGVMGSGIAQVAAQSGYNVTVVDKTEAILENAKTNMRKSLKRIARRKFPDDSLAETVFVDDVFKKILSMSTDLQSSVKSADLIVEAVSENTDLKKQIFEQLDLHSPSSALLATNTSSVPLDDLSSVIKRKDKFAGMHFFNPVQVLKLLELVRSRHTSDESFNVFMAFAKKLGKTVIVCKDTPGYIVNRLLVPYCFEALRMLERGDSSMPDIDNAMRLGAGYPMGPFELMDYIGIDNMKYIMDIWHQQFPNDSLFEPSVLLDKLLEAGNLGRKSGEGFYKYP